MEINSVPRTPVGENADPSQLSRRALLYGALGLAAGLFSGCSGQANTGTTQENAPLGKELHVDIAHLNPFEGTQAEQYADALRITAGSYYKLTAEAVSAVSGEGLFRTEDTLAPIFFPTIMAQKDVIESASKKFGVPPNIFATLASIESAGIVSARSGADAYGLVQVVPRYHMDKFLPYLPEGASYKDYVAAKQGKPSLVELDTYTKVFTDPQINTEAGAKFFAECIDQARKDNPGIGRDSLIIYARAAAMYNGGQQNAGKKFENMPTESKLYVNHVARILMDAELALRMRRDGVSDNDILRALKSKTMDALAYTYGAQSRGAYSDYENQAATIARCEDASKLPDAFKALFEEYMLGRVDTYQTPMSPGLRIWFAGGGRALFMSSTENVNWRA